MEQLKLLANLLCEFKIEEKKDAKQIKNKNGKVIRVKSIAISIFSISPINPGAISDTNPGINICTTSTKIKNRRLKNKRLKILFANLLAFILSFD